MKKQITEYWVTLPKYTQYEIETHLAIVLPALGSILGTALILAF
ncbi:hypothetical protein [Pseudoalteromonas sp. MTN2-4]